ncbi:hypothetical protein ZWY2020_021975 [Hordeum vulgare]|nr:hypothetical protein ZWY2020_021975 [Hordeum vulgare]
MAQLPRHATAPRLHALLQQAARCAFTPDHHSNTGGSPAPLALWFNSLASKGAEELMLAKPRVQVDTSLTFAMLTYIYLRKPPPTLSRLPAQRDRRPLPHPAPSLHGSRHLTSAAALPRSSTPPRPLRCGCRHGLASVRAQLMLLHRLAGTAPAHFASVVRPIPIAALL